MVNEYFLFRIVVVICSVLATVYYGYECTKKYISDPIIVSDEMVPLESLPPLQWSICKQVHLTDCTIQDYSEYYFSLFDNDYYYDYDTTNDSTSVGKYNFFIERFLVEKKIILFKSNNLQSKNKLPQKLKPVIFIY